MRNGARAAVTGMARGTMAAMAMSGLRQVTTSLGLVARVPPESVLCETAPRLMNAIPVAQRTALVEVIHWGYGAFGGVLFGMLPRQLRRRPWTGPAFGTAFWLGFELVVKRTLGIADGEGGVSQKLALAADHILYGMVVGASEWPYRD
ncbi:hypothetical protein GCM10009779_09000 [Polymorphospora rubra]|uniref:Uncharacterized protein n=2 Tax=Polymorphospora rubra TaxID=338584 RepID=A0A810N9A8_9ACTN|nr:hypothetical protein Prubr_66610 [Polymorphospora rubra]